MLLFWECGYEGILMLVLVEVLGIVLVCIYVVFGSKE